MARSIGSLTIPFDWNDLDALETSLRRLEIVGFNKAAIETKHSSTLRSSQDLLFATDIAIANAVELAEGHADLAVLLLEPADIEETILHSEELPPTIKCIDNELLKSCRTRDWRNTCIMDIRPFRSNAIRMSEAVGYQQEQDELAYDVTKRMLNMLEPDVLLLCQSGTCSASNKFARSLSSSIGQFGKLSLYKLESKKEVIAINCFHPMYATKYTVNEDPTVNRIRDAALRFAFLQAVNILNGKVICGPGCKKLQDAVYGASRSSHMLLSTGLLDPSLDDRFKGIALAKNATADFTRKWQEMMSRKLAEENKELERFVSLVFELGLRPTALDTLGELRAALPTA